MSSSTKIGVIGYGLIGKAICKLFHASFQGSHATRYQVVSYDSRDTTASHLINSYDDYEKAVNDNDIIICCTPYHINKVIAEICIKAGKPYFDLTEDNEKADWIRDFANQHNNGIPLNMTTTKIAQVMPQCGLAPGAVSIIAANMTPLFDSIDSIEIRVGALPLNTNNEMKYYLSWSPEGLINEYNHLCKAKKNGELVLLQPLEGYETIVIDGIEYEAFNTSGGLGTLANTLDKARNINYKTIRYKGHRDKIKFLLNDLGFCKNTDVLASIFKQTVPYIDKDVVIIFIQITGEINGKQQVRQYVKKIYGDNSASAIEKTTAAGVCTAVEWFIQNRPSAVDLRNEHILYADLQQNRYWDIFRE